MNSITGLAPWERNGWLPGGDDLPDWLAALCKRHTEARVEYEKSISSLIDTNERVEAEARAWRRAVRDAVAAGGEPPTREGGDAIGEAMVEVAQEDTAHARRELAEMSCEVLNAIRDRRDEFADYYMRSSPELHHAVGRGPDGVLQSERERVERQRAMEAEPAIPDIDDPENRELTELGDPEVSHAA